MVKIDVFEKNKAGNQASKMCVFVFFQNLRNHPKTLKIDVFGVIAECLPESPTVHMTAQRFRCVFQGHFNSVMMYDK